MSQIHRKRLDAAPENARLVPRNLLHRVPQHGNMINTQLRDHGGGNSLGRQHVGGIVLASDPTLHDNAPDALPQEHVPRQNGQEPEEERFRRRALRRGGVRPLPPGTLGEAIPQVKEGMCERLLGHGLAVDGDSLSGTDQMRTGVRPDGAVPPQHGRGECADGAFALCARHVDMAHAAKVRGGIACAAQPVQHFGNGCGIEVPGLGCCCVLGAALVVEELGRRAVGLQLRELVKGIRVAAGHGAGEPSTW